MNRQTNRYNFQSHESNEREQHVCLLRRASPSWAPLLQGLETPKALKPHLAAFPVQGSPWANILNFLWFCEFCFTQNWICFTLILLQEANSPACCHSWKGHIWNVTLQVPRYTGPQSCVWSCTWGLLLSSWAAFSGSKARLASAGSGFASVSKETFQAPRNPGEDANSYLF